MKKPIASLIIPVLALSILVAAHFVAPGTPFDEAPHQVVSEFVPQYDPPPPRKPPVS